LRSALNPRFYHDDLGGYGRDGSISAKFSRAHPPLADLGARKKKKTSEMLRRTGAPFGTPLSRELSLQWANQTALGLQVATSDGSDVDDKPLQREACDAARGCAVGRGPSHCLEDLNRRGEACERKGDFDRRFEIRAADQCRNRSRSPEAPHRRGAPQGYPSCLVFDE